MAVTKAEQKPGIFIRRRTHPSMAQDGAPWIFEEPVESDEFERVLDIVFRLDSGAEIRARIKDGALYLLSPEVSHLAALSTGATNTMEIVVLRSKDK